MADEIDLNDEEEAALEAAWKRLDAEGVLSRSRGNSDPQGRKPSGGDKNEPKESTAQDALKATKSISPILRGPLPGQAMEEYEAEVRAELEADLRATHGDAWMQANKAQLDKDWERSKRLIL